MPYKDVAPPGGEKITRTDRLNVPDQPIIPFIRGDGTGPDIWGGAIAGVEVHGLRPYEAFTRPVLADVAARCPKCAGETFERV